MPQVVAQLHSKCGTLSLIPNAIKKEICQCKSIYLCVNSYLGSTIHC
jgi:hypothetical protein